jgi:hypothetical protein
VAFSHNDKGGMPQVVMSSPLPLNAEASNSAIMSKQQPGQFSEGHEGDQRLAADQAGSKRPGERAPVQQRGDKADPLAPSRRRLTSEHDLSRSTPLAITSTWLRSK